MKSSGSSGNVPIRRKKNKSKLSPYLRVSHNKTIKSRTKLLSAGYKKTFTKQHDDRKSSLLSSWFKKPKKDGIKLLTVEKFIKASNFNAMNIWVKYLEFIHRSKVKNLENFTATIYFTDGIGVIDYHDNIEAKMPKMLSEMENITERYVVSLLRLEKYTNEYFRDILSIIKDPKNKYYYDNFVTPLINQNVMSFPVIQLLIICLNIPELLPQLDDLKEKLKTKDTNDVLTDFLVKNKFLSSDKQSYTSLFLNKTFRVYNRNVSMKHLFKDDFIGHSNIILFDRYTKEVELFEPHGSYLNDMINSQFKIDSVLEKFFKEHNNFGYTYIRNYNFCPEASVQTLQAKSYNIIANDNSITEEYSNMFKDTGYCMLWTLWYVDMRLLNSELSREELLTKINKQHERNPQFSQIVIQNFWTCMRIYLKYKLFYVDVSDDVILTELAKCRHIIDYSQIKI